VRCVWKESHTPHTHTHTHTPAPCKSDFRMNLTQPHTTHKPQTACGAPPVFMDFLTQNHTSCHQRPKIRNPLEILTNFDIRIVENGPLTAKNAQEQAQPELETPSDACSLARFLSNSLARTDAPTHTHAHFRHTDPHPLHRHTHAHKTSTVGNGQHRSPTGNFRYRIPTGNFLPVGQRRRALAIRHAQLTPDVTAHASGRQARLQLSMEWEPCLASGADTSYSKTLQGPDRASVSARNMSRPRVTR
jgi:hypothetical protein